MTGSRLRINWTIPAPIILAILAQAVILGLLVGAWKTAIEKDMEKDRQDRQTQFQMLDKRIEVVERGLIASAVLSERVGKVEVKIDNVEKQTTRIESKVDSLVERRR